MYKNISADTAGVALWDVRKTNREQYCKCGDVIVWKKYSSVSYVDTDQNFKFH